MKVEERLHLLIGGAKKSYCKEVKREEGMANFVSTMMIDFMRYLGNSNVRIEYWQ
jgi:hypothetical protein